MLTKLQRVHENLCLAVNGIINGKCKSETVLRIEEAMEELYDIISKMEADKTDSELH